MAQVSRSGALVGALVLALLVLAGCSDDPPSGSPPPSTSSSPTSSASTPSGPPTMPAAAKGRTAEAAEAFVRYYVDLINYATATLDTSAMEAVSLRSCENCQSIVTIAKNMKDGGRHYEGGRWDVASVEEVSAPSGTRTFQMVVRVGDLKVVAADGGVDTVEAKRTLVTVGVRRDGGWKVAEFQGVDG